VRQEKKGGKGRRNGGKGGDGRGKQGKEGENRKGKYTSWLLGMDAPVYTASLQKAKLN